jgi:hypothetical protein
VISKIQHRDVEININDNGFYIMTEDNIQAARAFSLIKSKDIKKIAVMSLDKTEVLARRFRHCATRAMMILRTYMGKRKSVGRQQLSSRLLINSVRQISEEFPMLKEARREILEDLMDINSAEKIIEHIEHNRIHIKEIQTDIPSPFAFNIITMGYTDIMKMEDKLAFLRRMHDMVRAKISLKEARSQSKVGKEKEKIKISDKIFDYEQFWNDEKKQTDAAIEEKNERLKFMAWDLKHTPFLIREHIVDMIEGKTKVRSDFVDAIKECRREIEDNWPKELREFLYDKLIELKELPEDYLDKKEEKN